MAEVKIKSVYLWQNGMLMVFGEDGQQIAELQGLEAECGDKVAALFPRSRWVRASWPAGGVGRG